MWREGSSLITSRVPLACCLTLGPVLPRQWDMRNVIKFKSQAEQRRTRELKRLAEMRKKNECYWLIFSRGKEYWKSPDSFHNEEIVIGYVDLPSPGKTTGHCEHRYDATALVACPACGLGKNPKSMTVWETRAYPYYDKSLYGLFFLFCLKENGRRSICFSCNNKLMAAIRRADDCEAIIDQLEKEINRGRENNGSGYTRFAEADVKQLGRSCEQADHAT